MAIISFLTIVPSARYNLSDPIDIRYTAKYMYLFPLVGALIGASAGAVGYGLSLVFEPQVTSLLVVLFITLITGLHHTDALADCADGLMAKGGRDSKKKAMRDHSIGSAGGTALILYFIGIFVVLSTIPDSTLFLPFLLTSEVIAKYMMVVQAHLGKPAWNGASSPFALEMKSRTKIIISTMIMLPLVFVATGKYGLVTLAVAFVMIGIVQYVAQINFGGVSGDVMGATNEVVRLTCLIVLSTISGLLAI